MSLDSRNDPNRRATNTHRLPRANLAPLTQFQLAVDLTLARTEREVTSDGRVWTRALSNHVAPTAQGQFNRAARRFQNASGSSVQAYRLEDSAIGCYGRTVVVKDNTVVTARDGC